MLRLLKKFKPAVTLAELLIVFIIIGVVAGMTVMTAKPADKAYRYIYMRVYNSLGTAFYNSTVKLPTWAIGNPNFDGTFPTDHKLFCRMLIEYINDTVGDGIANCNADMVNLRSYPTANSLNTYLRTHNPHFVASNGVRFWIARNNNSSTASSLYPNPQSAEYGIIRINPGNTVSNDSSFTTSAGSTVELRFYTVIADLNGKKGPNDVNWAMNKSPVDIVAFAVTENADVIPLGGPIFDTRYLTARVAYNTTRGTDDADINTSSSLSFYEASKRAWGTKYNPGGTRGAIYPNQDEALSYPVFEDRSVKDLNNSFPAASVFGISLNSLDTKAREYVNTVINREFDNTADASKSYSQGNCTNDSGTFDPNACYVKIDDFH